MKTIKFLLIFWIFLLVSCGKSDAPTTSSDVNSKAIDNSLNIKSDSIKFMGQELGKKVSGSGELYYDDDKGCFLKIKNGIVADCMLKSKIVYKITINCEKNRDLLSIDDVVCGEKIENQSSYKKLCSESTINEGYFLRKNKAFYWLDNFSQVVSMGITADDQDLRGEGEMPYSVKTCTNIPSSGSKAPENSRAEYLGSPICESAKGAAINKCLNMQTGMAGMASCDEAVNLARSACRRSDLTILSILDEASKKSNK